MEVEQSRRVNDDLVQPNQAEENAGSNAQQNESNEQVEIVASPQFLARQERPYQAALAGNSVQNTHPQTSPTNLETSPLIDDGILEQQLANFKPTMKKNAQSHNISPTNKRKLNMNMNDVAQAPSHVLKNLNQTSTHKRFQTGKNVLRGYHADGGGASTNLDLLLSRNSRNERLSSNQMQGLSSIISGSESEFSFKKNPSFFSKERNDKFEMSLTNM